MSTNFITSMYDKVDNVKWKDIFSLDNAMENVFKILGAVLVLGIAHGVGSLVYSVMNSWARALEESGLKATDIGPSASSSSRQNMLADARRSIVVGLVGSILYFVSIVIGFVIMLRIFGFEIATIVTALGTILLVVTFSLQGTFSDIASGILLAFFQTYDIGDIIQINDIEGRVVEFGVVNTLLEHMSTRALITIPNTTVQNSIIVNYSRHRHHMFTFDITLASKQPIYLRDLIEGLEKELGNSKKFPDIVRHPAVKSSAGIHDLSSEGVTLRVSVPFLVSPDLNSKRTRVRTGVLKELEHMQVLKLDNGYDYILIDELSRSLRERASASSSSKQEKEKTAN